MLFVSVVEELEKIGDRLCYKLISGSGPQTAWASWLESKAVSACPGEHNRERKGLIATSAPQRKSVGECPGFVRLGVYSHNRET